MEQINENILRKLLSIVFRFPLGFDYVRLGLFSNFLSTSMPRSICTNTHMKLALCIGLNKEMSSVETYFRFEITFTKQCLLASLMHTRFLFPLPIVPLSPKSQPFEKLFTL